MSNIVRINAYTQPESFANSVHKILDVDNAEIAELHALGSAMANACKVVNYLRSSALFYTFLIEEEQDNTKRNVFSLKVLISKDYQRLERVHATSGQRIFSTQDREHQRREHKEEESINNKEPAKSTQHNQTSEKETPKEKDEETTSNRDEAEEKTQHEQPERNESEGHHHNASQNRNERGGYRGNTRGPRGQGGYRGFRARGGNNRNQYEYRPPTEKPRFEDYGSPAYIEKRPLEKNQHSDHEDDGDNDRRPFTEGGRGGGSYQTRGYRGGSYRGGDRGGGYRGGNYRGSNIRSYGDSREDGGFSGRPQGNRYQEDEARGNYSYEERQFRDREGYRNNHGGGYPEKRYNNDNNYQARERFEKPFEYNNNRNYNRYDKTDRNSEDERVDVVRTRGRGAPRFQSHRDF